MDKKKFEQIKKEAVNKVEDSIVKAKIFIEKHPVACAIGGTAIGAVIAGAIGKKVGFKDGYETMADKAESWVRNDQPMDEVYLNGEDGNKFVEDSLAMRNLLRGACAMHLEDGDAVAVVRTAGELFVDTTLESDPAVLDIIRNSNIESVTV